MRRAPIVIAGTAVGLAGVLTYHTSASPITLTGATATTRARTATARVRPATSRVRPTTRSSATTTPRHAATRPRTRSAVGAEVSDPYGDLQVKVTRSGSRITRISLVRLDDRDPRSQSIDESAVPQLRQEALAAQSAKIDGVSGASYTSAAYERSLQSALDKLA